MKALSIWQPWAQLIVSGKKKIETRGWPAPPSIIGQRIAIVATKAIRREQREAANDPEFARHYAASGLPALDNLPLGAVFGTVTVLGCRAIDLELMDQLSEQELAFGWYGPDRYAWLLDGPELLDVPVPVRGGQGPWNWTGP